MFTSELVWASTVVYVPRPILPLVVKLSPVPVVTELVSVAARLELVPAPSMAPPEVSVTVSSVFRVLEAQRLMPPGLVSVSVPEVMLTLFPRLTLDVPVRVANEVTAEPFATPPAPPAAPLPEGSANWFCAVAVTVPVAVMAVLSPMFTVALVGDGDPDFVVSDAVAAAPLPPRAEARMELALGAKLSVLVALTVTIPA